MHYESFEEPHAMFPFRDSEDGLRKVSNAKRTSTPSFTGTVFQSQSNNLTFVYRRYYLNMFTEEVVTTPPQIFAIKPPILLIFVLEDSYG